MHKARLHNYAGGKE